MHPIEQRKSQTASTSSIGPGPSFGRDLLDNQPLVEQFGQDGNEALVRIIDYVKKRAAVAEDYGRALAKLNKAFSSGPKDEVLEELLLQSEQSAQIHAAIHERIQEDVLLRLKLLAREHEKRRKETLAELKDLRVDWKKTTGSFDKARRSRDQAVRSAEDARVAYERADLDKNVTKAFVEKTFEDFQVRTQKATTSIHELIAAYEEIRPKEEHYERVQLPTAFNKLQQVEEHRLQELYSTLQVYTKMLSEELAREARETREAVKASRDPNDRIVQFVMQNRSDIGKRDPAVSSIDVEAELALADALAACLEERQASMVSGGNIGKLGPKSRTNSFESRRSFDEVKTVTSPENLLAEIGKVEKQLEGVRVLSDLYQKQPHLADQDTRREVAQQMESLSNRLKSLQLQKDRQGGKAVMEKPKGVVAVSWDDDDDEDGEELPKEVTSTILEALYDYESRPGTEELSFRQGDRFRLLAKTNAHWWKVERIGKGDCGLVPFNYVSTL